MSTLKLLIDHIDLDIIANSMKHGIFCVAGVAQSMRCGQLTKLFKFLPASATVCTASLKM